MRPPRGVAPDELAKELREGLRLSIDSNSLAHGTLSGEGTLAQLAALQGPRSSGLHDQLGRGWESSAGNLARLPVRYTASVPPREQRWHYIYSGPDLAQPGGLPGHSREAELDGLPLSRAGPLWAVLRGARVSEGWVHADPEELIPLPSFYRVLEQASRNVELFFGALAGEGPATSVGNFGRIVSQSPSLYEALRRFVSYGNQLGTLHPAWLVEDRPRDAVWLCRAGPLAFERGVDQAELMVLRFVVGIVRLAAGETWKPPELRFCSGDAALLALGAIEAFQDVPAKVRQPWGGVCIPRSLLALSMPDSENPVRDSLEEWSRSAPAMGFADSLRQVLLSFLKVDSKLRLDTVAEAAGLHSRTLQRRLLVEKTQFRTVLVEARLLRARDLLAQSDMKVTEIALELGYSDPAHFTRAYRRWLGVPPSAHRRARLELPR